jgi:hypothetical protein
VEVLFPQPEEIDQVESPIASEPSAEYPFPFDNSVEMLEMSEKYNKTIWQMKLANELHNMSERRLIKSSI